MGYEGGVRVLQSLGNWTPEIPSTVPRPNLIPFTEPYVEGGSMHPSSRLKALQQVQQASQGIRKANNSKSKIGKYIFNYFIICVIIWTLTYIVIDSFNVKNWYKLFFFMSRRIGLLGHQFLYPFLHFFIISVACTNHNFSCIDLNK